MWKEFESARPHLFGAILDTLSKAQMLRPTVKLWPRFRMADFAVWGCAIARAMDVSEETFAAALRRNNDRHIVVALESSPLAMVLLEFMQSRQRFEGSPTELYRQLGGVRGVLEVSGSKAWPQTPSALTRQLNVVKPVLRRLGIEITTARDSTRLIILERVEVADDADGPVGAPGAVGPVTSVGSFRGLAAVEVDETDGADVIEGD